ncbi:MAG: hypothetical protein HY692_05770, partial [Cyanobacteria bacterium NC_groundwater_1444_Ag_S-0.65um_54_12]|nr:hypothetical protein [Cyanobacteria bacterium NC_groundwater_1444_Ag_S-0.65um_54_12]
MAYRKTQSFRRSDQPAPASALSFWRRLFGGKAVRKEQLVREQPRSKTERITGTLTISGPLADRGTSRPKSFISKKFDSQPVKAALLNAIGQAMDSPPAELEPNQHQNWLDGLARKGLLVERLDCSKLKPDEHLRAIQWLAKIEALSPLKLTYREDLFGLRYRLATLQDRTKDVSGQLPEAVAHGGIALRRLCQSLRQKSEKLAEMSSKAATNATLEIALYDCLLE